MTLRAFLDGAVSGGLVAAVCAYPVLSLIRLLKARQTINRFAPEAHQAKQGTPTMGGFVVLAGLAGLAAIRPETAPVVGWVLLFGLIGFVDDFVVPRLMPGKRGLGWLPKLAMQVGAAAAAPGLIGLSFSALSVAVSVVAVLFFVNAYNFADGLDGLAGSLGLVHFSALAALAAVLGVPLPAAVLGATVGGLTVFLFLNAPPAKVFMGDTGSLALGALMGLATLAFFVGPAGQMRVGPSLGPLVVLSLMMVAELVPVPIQVGWYKLTKKRLFPMTPIHHGFETVGWPESRVVWCFALAQFVFAIVAIWWALNLGGAA
ncbi:MAG: hypothetical protein KIS66_01070 [Fimbriimonadaceae bacterium]|nr:hypothetical protein [Fimbriimonadaceae bacterium]